LTATLAPSVSSGLADLADTVGGLPRVMLRDSGFGGWSGPVVQPSSSEMPALGDRFGRLQLLGEIARGGMGAVIKGRDPDLGRDLAVKVLLESHRDKPDLIRRFVEEAQIGGQLQHPGIVPIYELGTFADRRPYFAMKLVKGRTLSSILDERSDPAQDLSRFLSIFGAVCQTIAYAHARGVIHRDLKPSNIMVGAFGEVQVMDWGLAKVLPQGGVADDASAGKTRTRDTVIATVRSGSDSDLSQAGSVLGTPSYMAPEQARGEIDRLDERCDVFALGSILCEILTGEPAFTGRSSAEIQRKAARGDLKEAADRLDSSAAGAELIGLAKDCLAPELEDRPRHAAELSTRVEVYQSGMEERLRAAEISRALEKTRAEEAGKRARVERDRLRLTIALATTILALIVLGGAGAFGLYSQQQQRLTAAEAVLARVETLHQQARTQGANPAAWREARAAADQALATIGDLVHSPAGRRLAALRITIAEDEKQSERDHKLMTELADFRAKRRTADEKGYVDAFIHYGLDLEATPVEPMVLRLKSLPEQYQREIVEFLDDWAIVRIEGFLMRGDDQYQGVVARPLAVARGLDRDPERNRLRSLLEQPDLKGQRPTLVALVKSGRAIEFGPSASLLLASALEKAGENEPALDVLRAAVVRYPGDLWANLALAKRLRDANPPLPAEAIRHFAIVRALRPVSGDELADLLINQGQPDEAEAIRRELARLQPDELHPSVDLARLLQRRGKIDDARSVMNRWIDQLRADATNPLAHLKLGLIHRMLYDHSSEIAELREAARLGPGNPDFNHELASALIRQGDLAGTIEAYRNALRIFPKDINCYYELAFALCLSDDHPGEIAALREAIRLQDGMVGGEPPRPEGPSETHDSWNDPYLFSYDAPFWTFYFDDFDQRHIALGNALAEIGDRQGAIAEYREAIRLGEADELQHYRYLGTWSAWWNEGKSHPHRYLGMALMKLGDLPGAIAEFREAIQMTPALVSADVGFNLCLALARSGNPAGAVAVVRQAIQQEPSHRLNPVPLLGAIVVMDQGADSIRALRGIREAAGGDRALIDWIDRAISLIERITALGLGLPKIIHSASRSDASYADACAHRWFFAASAALWSAAFAVEPTLVENLDGKYRYNAACAAAMASSGEGKDEPHPDDAAKSRFRQQALEWLKADLAARAKRLDGADPGRRSALARTLRGWTDDPNLASFRNEASIKKLPEDQQKGWRAFWSEVAMLLNKTEKY
jgi:serine/threonine-protein kinase